MNQIVVTVERLSSFTNAQDNKFVMVFGEEELKEGRVTYAVQESDQDKLLYISLRRGDDE